MTAYLAISLDNAQEEEEEEEEKMLGFCTCLLVRPGNSQIGEQTQSS